MEESILNMSQRVVITGMGIYSCIGKNKEEVCKSLYEGRSGIGIDPVRKEIGYRSALTGILEKPDLKGLLDRRQRLCLPEQGQYAYVATLEAMKQAGIAYATDQIIDLFANGIRNVHVYSMNKPDVAQKILENISAIIK